MVFSPSRVCRSSGSVRKPLIRWRGDRPPERGVSAGQGQMPIRQCLRHAWKKFRRERIRALGEPTATGRPARGSDMEDPLARRTQKPSSLGSERTSGGREARRRDADTAIAQVLHGSEELLSHGELTVIVLCRLPMPAPITKNASPSATPVRLCGAVLVRRPTGTPPHTGRPGRRPRPP